MIHSRSLLYVQLCKYFNKYYTGKCWKKVKNTAQKYPCEKFYPIKIT